jgi:nucleotide-binding universal stress UspA family protein
MVKRISTLPKNILLAVDGSEHSWAAVDFLRALPLPAETKINAVAVLIPREASKKSWALMHVLEATDALLRVKGVQVKTELITDYPAEALLAYAAKTNPELITIGALGLRATMGILLGGVAQQIVEYACCPVLVVRAPSTGLKRLLLVIDHSTHSQEALDYLAKFSLPADTEIRVMHVLPPLDTTELISHAWMAGLDAPLPMPTQEVEEIAARQAEEAAEGHALLNQAMETLRASGLDGTGVLLRGDAATEIIDYVREHKIDLVVAGCRGLSQVSGLLLGSVSRKLVHYADSSVMVVKTPSETTGL